MLKFDKHLWEIYDPDKILSYNKDNFDLNALISLGKIYPREDLMFFKNIFTNKTIDFGYYGCEIQLDGIWIVYVVDENKKNAWDKPLEVHKFLFTQFYQSINCIQDIIEKDNETIF